MTVISAPYPIVTDNNKDLKTILNEGTLPAWITADSVNERLGIGTAAPGHKIHVIMPNTNDSLTEFPAKFERVLDQPGNGTDIGRVVNIVADYEGIAAVATTPSMRCIEANMRYGGSGGTPVAAVGTAANYIATHIVRGSGSAGNEHTVLSAILRYENASVGRAWGQDMRFHGAVTTQQEIIVGHTWFMNNYFNGSPLTSESAAYVAATFPGKGGQTSTTEHTNATTFPMDVGFAVYGKSGTVATPTGVGYKTGFRAGGAGSGWEIAASILETAFHGRDVTIQGIKLDNPGAGSPKGIVMSGATWGTLIDLSGVTTPPAVGILMASNDIRWNTDGGGNIGASGAVGRPATIFLSNQWNVQGALIGRVSLSGGVVEMNEASADPAAPAANKGIIYMRDNGAGKTQFVARFPTGAVQVVATEP